MPKTMCWLRYLLQADRYDVAVIRLNRQVDYAPHISPICLPPKVDCDFTDADDIVEPCERFDVKYCIEVEASHLFSTFVISRRTDTDCFLSVKSAT